jgi:hypothetical protein
VDILASARRIRRVAFAAINPSIAQNVPISLYLHAPVYRMWHSQGMVLRLDEASRALESGHRLRAPTLPLLPRVQNTTLLAE